MRTEVEFVMYGTTNKKDKSGAYLFMPGGEASGISKGTSPVFLAIGPLVSRRDLAQTVFIFMHCVFLDI